MQSKIRLYNIKNNIKGGGRIFLPYLKGANMKNFRAPATPLITVDPYFNIWSFTDTLYGDTPRHWTGQRHFLTGIVTIDDMPLKFMGMLNPDNTRYRTEPDVIEQISCEIRPMTTKYVFENDKVTLKVDFMTPLIPTDLYLMSRPISYISYNIESKDGKVHDIKMYMDVSCELCVNTPDKAVTLGKTDYSLTASSGTENMLSHSGDDHRIEWGTLHLIAPGFETYFINAANKEIKFRSFIGNGKKYTKVECGKTVKPQDGWTALACQKDYGSTHKAQDFICIGYDDVKSIQYFGENIEAYWRRDGAQFEDIANMAVKDFPDICVRVCEFENELMEKARKISDKYEQIVSLAFRQAIAAHKLCWHNGEVQFLSKENYSNGCIGTVDVTYPSIPLFLIYNPELVEGMLNPIFKMCSLGMWKYEFAPHDVGQYPLANMQVYGIGDKYTKRFLERRLYEKGMTLEQQEESYQMPIEECGNMLLCVAAVCAAKKDTSYAKAHLDILNQWADYLVKCGFDPANQLCTDDFAGHLAHNCNLSVKAIEALAAWSKILDRLGENAKSAFYRVKAEEFAKCWEQNADAGDHYKLAFDQNSESWSLKYNMVWDKLLDLNVFNSKIAEKEVDYYMTKVNRFGVPLDVRSDYTKSDWQMWTTVLTNNKKYRDAVIEAMYDMLENTRDRVPFTDWYFTSTPYMRGFQNRTVQGGLFINLLNLK